MLSKVQSSAWLIDEFSIPRLPIFISKSWQCLRCFQKRICWMGFGSSAGLRPNMQVASEWATLIDNFAQNLEYCKSKLALAHSSNNFLL
jgi:hypothetical protein